ncbi:MAG TPA: 1-phosphofructokinase [Kofleriaceae bacterium]|nr:1-phosphofructokinase [Kofleriaceae bacterium]
MIYTLTLNPAVDRELRVAAIRFGDVLRATSHRVDWGGKGFNVSRALRALGGDSIALGLVGGFAGQMIATGLRQLGITVDFVEVAGETRTNVVVMDGEHHLKVNEAGPEIEPADEALLLDKVRALARSGDWWVLSGSLPPGASPRVYAEVIQIVQSAGARAVLDTSGAALAHGVAARPFLVKPNASEAAEVTGRAVDSFASARDAARDLCARGARHVVISLGRRGALLWDGASAWTARPPRVIERNPVGAGDAMVGGLVHSLAQHVPVASALRCAVACGAAAASLDGTAVGDRAQIAELERQVEVAELDLAADGAAIDGGPAVGRAGSTTGGVR